MSVFRRKGYRFLSRLGDVEALASGSPKRIARRAYNRTVFKTVARLTSRAMWRK